MNLIKGFSKQMGGQYKLASFLGVTRQAVHKWTKNTSRIPPLQVLKMAKKFQVSPQKIMPNYPWEEII